MPSTFDIPVLNTSHSSCVVSLSQLEKARVENNSWAAEYAAMAGSFRNAGTAEKQNRSPCFVYADIVGSLLT